MGVEYTHYLVVNDPVWKPETDTAARVDAVLRRWALVDQLKRTVDLTGGGHKPIAADVTSAKIGAGVDFIYAGVKGAPVARIAGPPVPPRPHYSGPPLEDGDRHTMQTSLVLGSDYRIHRSSESYYFEVTTSPTVNGRPIAAHEREYRFRRGDELYVYLDDQSFPSEGRTHWLSQIWRFATGASPSPPIVSPPVVRIHVEDHAKANVAWSSYQGFWRGALVIDFGKDLPAFCEGIHALPARDFVAEVAEAFRGPLAEVGEFN